MSKKPSERIQKLYKILEKDYPDYKYSILRTMAIIDYLDEEWANRPRNINTLSFRGKEYTEDFNGEVKVVPVSISDKQNEPI